MVLLFLMLLGNKEEAAGSRCLVVCFTNILLAKEKRVCLAKTTRRFVAGETDSLLLWKVLVLVLSWQEGGVVW